MAVNGGTGAIMASLVALGVGVVDPGLGAGFGINILSSDEEIRRQAGSFIETVQGVIK